MPPAEKTNVAHGTIDLPCSSDDIRGWALNLSAANPIGSTPIEESVRVDISDNLHCGVELTFTVDDRPVYVLTVFGLPNAAEAELERSN